MLRRACSRIFSAGAFSDVLALFTVQATEQATAALDVAVRSKEEEISTAIETACAAGNTSHCGPIMLCKCFQQLFTAIQVSNILYGWYLLTPLHTS